MSAVPHELITIAFFVVVGWVALWPSRNRLGVLAYHLAALPAGLMAAPLALAVSSTIGRPLGALSATAGALVLTAGLWGLQRAVLPRDAVARHRVAPLSFLVAVGVMAAFGTIVGLLGFTATNFDSMASYWPLGVLLSRKGAFTIMIAASRSPLIPSMNAIHVMFGSDWAYVIYPVLAVTFALWIAVTLWEGPLSASGWSRRGRLIVAGGSIAFLALEPSFVFNALLVHSNMISGLYLIMSLSSIWMAVRPDTDDVEPAYLILAGIFAAGLALTRPDGLVYVFVPVAVAISALTVSKIRLRDVVAFFAPLLVLVLGVFAAGYYKLGMWHASKLNGRTALAVLAVLALSSAGPWLVEHAQRLVPVRVSGEGFLGVAVPVAAVLMVAVFVLKWGSAKVALENAGINLFLGAGGYNYLWYAAVVILVLSVLTGDALRNRSWTRSPFLGIMFFFVIAGLVHGTSHEGRIGPGDSFSRVAFEIVPVVVWFAGAMVARILSPASDTDSA